MSLTAILATRGRPHLLLPTIEQTLKNIVRPDTKLVVAIDHDDHATIDVVATLRDTRIVPSVMQREDTLGEKYNARVPVCPADVYLVMVDYAPMMTPGFDSLLLQAANLWPDKIGIIYGNRLPNLSFPEINAVTHKLVDIMGGIYPPYWPYWFVDHWLDDIAKMINRWTVAPIWHDGTKRPGTQEMREPAFWASLYDDLAILRHRQAEEIMSHMCDEPWRKDANRRTWCLTDQRSAMINDNVRAHIRANDLPHDQRYARVKAQATAMLQHLGRQRAPAAPPPRPALPTWIAQPA